MHKKIQITTDAETAAFCGFTLAGAVEAMKLMFANAMPNLTPKQRELARNEQECLEGIARAFGQADIVEDLTFVSASGDGSEHVVVLGTQEDLSAEVDE